MVSDQTGALAAVRGGNDALVLRDGGNALRLDDTSCIDPFRPDADGEWHRVRVPFGSAVRRQ